MKNSNFENAIVEYESGKTSVKLSPNIIKNYLVSGGGNVTDQEIVMFLNLCKAQKLNPFLREAYLIKYNNQKSQIVIGKDVFTKRAMNNPTFSGFEAGTVIRTENGGIENRNGTLVLDGEKIAGGWAKVYVKGYQVPIEAVVTFSEYCQTKDGEPTALWKSKPATMIRKVALVQALREAFPEDLQGLYDTSEMPVDSSVLDEKPIEIENDITSADIVQTEPENNSEQSNQKNQSGDYITMAQAKLLFANAKNDVVKSVIAEFGYDSTKLVLKKDFDNILKRLADEKINANKLDESIEITANEVTDESEFDDTLPWETSAAEMESA